MKMKNVHKLPVIATSWLLLVLPADEKAGAADVDFVKEIQPILEKSCLKCHGEKRPKARLSLHTREALLKGGKSGKIVEPGSPIESPLYARVTLPEDDDDAMPPEGDRLTKAETDTIAHWIRQGASWPEGLVLSRGLSEEEDAPAAALPGEEALAKLREAGALVLVAPDDGWLSVSFRSLGAEAVDDKLALLEGMAALADLNLAGTGVTDEGLAHLAGLVGLRRLHLEKTKITGAGLAHLKGLEKLEYLNLYDTPLADEGLAHLAGLKGLKKLYLWQTQVTDGGVDALSASLPELDVNRGLELAAVVSAAPPPQAPAPAEPAAAPAAGEGKVIVPEASGGWRYIARSKVEGGEWVKPEFDHGGWAEGKAPLGHGEAVIAEKGGTAVDLKGEALLFRRELQVDAATIAAATGYRLLVASDNSAVVWLNGAEVDRDEADHEVVYWNRTVAITKGAVVEGRNVIAVELHNTPNSSDAVLDLRLEALVQAGN
jgi:mono/diheme cytochrome c family protein